MKISKRIVSLFVLVSFLFVANFSFAASNDNIKNLLKKDSIEQSNEKDEVLNSLKDSLDQLENNFKTKNQDISIDKDSTALSSKKYKLYLTNSGDVIKDYKLNNNFEKLISNKYIWQTPIIDSTGQVIAVGTIVKGRTLEELKIKSGSIKKEDEDIITSRVGKWYLESVGNNIPSNWAEFISNNDELSAFLLKSDINNPSHLKLVCLPGLNSYMLYISNKGDEFGIPFTNIENEIGVKNGSLYKMSELISIYEKSDLYLTRNSNGNPDSFGSSIVQVNNVGLKKNSQSQKSNLFIPITSLICVLLVIGSALVIITRRKKHVFQN